MLHYNYNIEGPSIAKVNTIRELGIIFDSKLTFEPHVNTIVKKAYRTLDFLFRSLGKFKKVETSKLLYFTYVRSGLEYGTPIWNPYYRVHIDSIEKVQRRFSRTLFRRFHFIPEKHYSMRYMRLDMLSLEERRTLTDELALYKIHPGKIITHLNHALRYNDQSRFTRQNNDVFYLPFVTTNVEYYSPMLRMQRNHDLAFNRLDLNDHCLASFKRYAIHEIKNKTNSFRLHL